MTRLSSKASLLEILFFIVLVFVLTSTTLLFGIRYGRNTVTIRSSQCPMNTFSPPMWDVAHVPNPPPVYHPRVFEEISDTKSFQSVEDAVNDDSWSALLTPNGGLLRVQQQDGHVGGYGVSMFHQLHCLTMIRDMLLGQPMSHAHETNDWSEDNMHWLHCLDYLAQGVLCAADDTLEKPGFKKNVDGKMVKGIDGMGHTHQCRNSSHLFETVASSSKIPMREELLGPHTVFKPVGLDSEGKPWVDDGEDLSLRIFSNESMTVSFEGSPRLPSILGASIVERISSLKIASI